MLRRFIEDNSCWIMLLLPIVLLLGIFIFKTLYWDQNLQGFQDHSHNESMRRMMNGDYPSDDRTFLTDMILHHQMAVDMAEHLLKYTKNPALIDMCNNIIRVQKREIVEMRELLN